MCAGILVRMLKREKRQNDAAHLTNITEDQSLDSQKSLTKPVLRKESTDTPSADRGIHAVQYIKRGILILFVFCICILRTVTVAQTFPVSLVSTVMF